ncbi:glycosyltransferase family 87 protein [Pseudonocardia spinosispora]|uniref:glycosyltransferase family 87 protein n=1 Tax=Pseudonocardia spinosispora TaxID=103441 RepID=UPI00041FA581|nr:glycosyltransferase family 87 protein [Pseudonocardia spinosispora]
MNGARLVGKGLCWAIAGAALLTATWLFVRFGSGNAVRLATPDMRVHIDFETFWRSSYALIHHADLYRTGAQLANLNPPVLAVLMAPLAWLDVLTAYHAFALFNALLIVGSVVAVADHVRLRPAWAMVVTAAVLAAAPLHGTLALGQMYGLLTAALTVAWLAERRDRGLLAGVALGIAVALKPSLVPLLLWPVLRRRWNTTCAALAAGIAVTGIGVLVAGWSATVEWLGVLDRVQVTGYLDNDSLAAFMVRFGRPEWLGYLAALVLLAVTVSRARQCEQYAIWSITAGSLLLAPIAWNNYLVLLFPSIPLLIAGARGAEAVLVMALPTIGIEWASLFSTNSAPARLGLSLYCGMLLSYWAVLTFAPPDGSARRHRDVPVTVAECQVPLPPAHDRSPVHSPSS